MKRTALYSVLLIIGAFLAGFFAHRFYQGWDATPTGRRGYPVTFSPLSPGRQGETEIPVVQAADVDRIRALAGRWVRVRGRVFRVGHSTKSNTYFLNFGPSRASLTGVIFSSALELFAKGDIDPMSYEGTRVELTGEIKDHPRYGLEIILEDPSQVKRLD